MAWRIAAGVGLTAGIAAIPCDRSDAVVGARAAVLLVTELDR